MIFLAFAEASFFWFNKFHIFGLEVGFDLTTGHRFFILPGGNKANGSQGQAAGFYARVRILHCLDTCLGSSKWGYLKISSPRNRLVLDLVSKAIPKNQTEGTLKWYWLILGMDSHLPKGNPKGGCIQGFWGQQSCVKVCNLGGSLIFKQVLCCGRPNGTNFLYFGFPSPLFLGPRNWRSSEPQSNPGWIEAGKGQSQPEMAAAACVILYVGYTDF